MLNPWSTVILNSANLAWCTIVAETGGVDRYVAANVMLLLIS